MDDCYGEYLVNLLERIANALEIIAGTSEKNKAEEPAENKNVICIDDIPLWQLSISRRTRNALLRYGIKTLGDIKALSIYDLEGIRNIGISAITDINIMLDSYGLEQKRYSMNFQKGGD